MLPVWLFTKLNRSYKPQSVYLTRTDGVTSPTSVKDIHLHVHLVPAHHLINIVMLIFKSVTGMPGTDTFMVIARIELKTHDARSE